MAKLTTKFYLLKKKPSSSETIIGVGKYGFVLKKKISDTEGFEAVKILYIYNDDNHNTNVGEMINKICETYQNFSQPGHPSICKIYKIEKHETSKKYIGQLNKLISSDNLSAVVKGQLDILKRRVQSKQSVLGLHIHMQYYSSSLRTFLENTLPPDRSEYHEYRIIQDVFDGINFLHCKIISHGDIRPENIFMLGAIEDLSSSGAFAVICDVGLSTHFVSNQQSAVGRSNFDTYRSPESRRCDETNHGAFNPKEDLFKLGLTMMEISQSINKSERRGIFDDIVYNEETDLIQDHKLITNCKPLIIELTQRNPSQRPEIGFIKFELSATLVGSTNELKLALRDCKPDDVILLKPGCYVGPFNINTQNVTMRGACGNVVLRNEQVTNNTVFNNPVLNVCANGITISDICIEMNSDLTSTGITVYESGVRISNVQTSGGFRGIRLCGDSPKVENIICTGSLRGVDVNCRNGEFENLSLSTHQTGIEVTGSFNNFRDIKLGGNAIGLKMSKCNKVTTICYQKPAEIRTNCVIVWYTDGKPEVEPTFSMQGLSKLDVKMICDDVRDTQSNNASSKDSQHEVKPHKFEVIPPSPLVNVITQVDAGDNQQPNNCIDNKTDAGMKVNTRSISDKLVHDPIVIREWTSLYYQLLPGDNETFARLGQQVANGTVTYKDLFHEILNRWVSREGASATIGLLETHLLKAEFASSAELALAGLLREARLKA